MKYKICRNCGQKNEYMVENCKSCGWNLMNSSHYDLEKDVFVENGENIVRLWSSKISIVFAIALTVVTIFFTYSILDIYFGDAIGESVRNSETIRIVKDKMGIDVLSIFKEKDVVTVSNDDETKSIVKTQSENVVDKTKKEKNSKYVLKDSSKKVISMAKLKKMSTRKLAVARNEIFARNGYTFKDGEWEKFFSKKAWYKPKYSADYFNNHYEELLNKYEKKNIKRIKKIEQIKGD